VEACHAKSGCAMTGELDIQSELHELHARSVRMTHTSDDPRLLPPYQQGAPDWAQVSRRDKGEAA
jgi:hypothetical protein